MAGVTIAALTGSDSAPTKANEASQKNDIGTAKDDIVLTAVNAQNSAYETAYVENGVAAGNASNLVGKTVVKALYDKYGASTTIGNATISIEVGGSADASNVNAITSGDITISTTDFELTGEVAISGGVITWGEIEPNVPGIKITGVPTSLDKGSFVYLSIKRKDVTEDVSWSSGKTSVATVDSSTGRVTGVAAGEAIITASVTENGTTYTDQCTITVVLPEQVIGQYVDLGTNILGNGTTKDWRILTKDSTGTWVILADYYPMTDAMATATGLTRVKSSGTNTTYNVNSNSQDNLIAGLTSSGWSSLTNKGTVYGAVTAEKLIESYNQKHGTSYVYTNYPTLDNTDTLYVPHNSSDGEEGCYGYWLASRYGSGYVWYVYCDGYVGNGSYSNANFGVRPAVYLGSNVTLTKTGSGENVVWTAQ